jgi:hypothetical protein
VPVEEQRYRGAAAILERCIMLSPKAWERRLEPRSHLARLASIQFGKDVQSRYCLATDISNGGVRLQINGFELPDEFVLFFAGDGPARDGTYRVIWRISQEVGAQFVSAIVPDV